MILYFKIAEQFEPEQFRFLVLLHLSGHPNCKLGERLIQRFMEMGALGANVETRKERAFRALARELELLRGRELPSISWQTDKTQHQL